MQNRGRKPALGLGLRNCAGCGREFQPYRDYQIACSRRCRDRTQGQSPLRRLQALVCGDCGAAFEAVWSGMGHQPPCDACAEVKRQALRDRKNLNRRGSDRVRQDSVRARLKRYGLTVEQYEEMRNRQGDRCAICSNPPDPDGVRATSRLHIDHDHGTGLNRELLCSLCNQGIGFLRDDPQLLRAAAEYIERHRNN